MCLNNFVQDCSLVILRPIYLSISINLCEKKNNYFRLELGTESRYFPVMLSPNKNSRFSTDLYKK